MLRAWYKYRYGHEAEGDDWKHDPIKPSDNFEKGFIAGIGFALSNQWRSIEDELPEEDEDVLVYNPKDAFGGEYFAVAYYDGEDWYTTDGVHIRPTHFMYIPELKTEQQ